MKVVWCLLFMYWLLMGGVSIWWFINVISGWVRVLMLWDLLVLGVIAFGGLFIASLVACLFC